MAFKTKLTLKPPCNIYKKHLQLKSDPLPMCIQRKLKVVNFKNISSINSGFNYWLGQTSVCNKLICSGLIFVTLHQNRSQVRLHCPPGSWLEEFKLISSCTSALLEELLTRPPWMLWYFFSRHFFTLVSSLYVMKMNPLLFFDLGSIGSSMVSIWKKDDRRKDFDQKQQIRCM